MIRPGVFQPQTLEVDERIFDRNLRIVDNVPEHEATNLNSFREERRSLLPEPDLPSVTVSPESGFCVKTKNVAGMKVFINLCKIQEIPPPPPQLTETKLKEIIATDDYATDFKVPMSLGAPRPEKDKSGNTCLCCDVAVNSAWFDDTMENSIVFTTFVVNVAMEGLCHKYGDDVNLDRQNWTVLKNRKYMGKLQRHQIQQRAKGNRIKEIDGHEATPATRTEPERNSRPDSMLVQEKKSFVTGPNSTARSDVQGVEVTPTYRIFKEPRTSDNPDLLRVEVEVPGVSSARNMTLDIGEDRIVLEARRAGYLLDCFVPFTVNQSRCSAQYNPDQQLLIINMPLVK